MKTLTINSIPIQNEKQFFNSSNYFLREIIIIRRGFSKILKGAFCLITQHWEESYIESYMKDGNSYSTFQCTCCGRTREQMWDAISDV
jgi:hypothetical protein